MKIPRYEPKHNAPYDIDIDYGEWDDGYVIIVEELYDWIKDKRKTANESQNKLLDELELDVWNYIGDAREKNE
jgi:hypothetical protein